MTGPRPLAASRTIRLTVPAGDVQVVDIRAERK